jgi:hypothetical protein
MKTTPYILLAPFHLKEGVSEAQLLTASRAFQQHFVSQQRGILRRTLMRAKHGGHADLVVFENQAVADRVMEAEANSEHFHALLALAQPPDPRSPDMGLLAFEQVEVYE